MRRCQPSGVEQRAGRRRACAGMPGTPSCHRATSRCNTSPSKGYRRMHWVGPSERDYKLLRAIKASRRLPLEGADAIVCTGLKDDRRETVEDYRDSDRGRRAARRCPLSAPILILWSTLAPHGWPAPVASLRSMNAWAETCSGPASRILPPTRPHSARAGRGRQRGRRRSRRILAIGDAVRTDMAAAQRSRRRRAADRRRHPQGRPHGRGRHRSGAACQADGHRGRPHHRDAAMPELVW